MRSASVCCHVLLLGATFSSISYAQTASVKPGISGLWQVSGRNDTSYEDRIQLDLFYIRHWSPWLDVYILAKTIVALISRDGAY